MQVLKDLPQLLREAENQFRAYYAGHDQDAVRSIRDPHVWINSEFIEGGTHWAFVIGSVEAPDYGLHIEFDGESCIDCWGGD